MKKVLTLAMVLPACVVPYAGPGDPYAQPASPPPPAYGPPPAQPPAQPPAYAPAYPPPPPPRAAPPPPQRRLGRDEAVQLAWQYAAQHGLQPARAREVEREDRSWKVELELAGGGKAKVVIDAWSGAELRFKVEGGHRRHGERHGEEHDEDDD